MNQPPKSDPKEPRPPQNKSAIDFDDDLEDSGSPWMAVGMIGAIVVIGAFVAFGVVQRGKQEASEAQAAAEAEAHEEEPALPDSAALDSLAREAAAAREAKAAEEAKAAAEAAKAAQQAAQPVELAEPAKFGIQVGSYLFEDRANEVLSAITSSASVQGRIVPGDDGSFAVVLGPFDSRNAAEAKGTELLGTGAVSESRVVTLKD